MNTIIRGWALAAALLLTGLAAGTAPATAASVKVGASAGPHAQIMEAVKAAAASRGLDVTVVEFADSVRINDATNAGELDANSFQHQPFLDHEISLRQYNLVPVTTTVLLPMAVYSNRYKSLADLPVGATIGIPNDPSNGARALVLLQEAGLIKLKADAGAGASQFDITDNPKKLKFLEMEAAQLARVLNDLDAAAITTLYALQAKLDPINGSLARETPQSVYDVVLVTRRDRKDEAWVKQLIEAFKSPEVKQFIADKFKGSVLTTW